MNAMTKLAGLRIALVGPLPPPAGGMATQTAQLARLLGEAGAVVEIVQTNPAYRPAWVARWRGLRALARLLPYLLGLWRAAGRSDLMHVMANSGWSWFLFAEPALRIAAWRRCPVVINYRGGEAASFLAGSASRVLPLLKRAQALVVPSGFLREVFARHGVAARVVPNIIDLARFAPGQAKADPPEILVARHLEPIYGLDVALSAFALLAAGWPPERPRPRLVIAGEGPERARLESQAQALGLADSVEFTGPLGREVMAQRLARARVALNASRADNMPNSVLEAMACGVPVVSTAVGGVPWVLKDGASGLLVAVDDPEAMARALRRVLSDESLACRLAAAAREDVQAYGWPRVRAQWVAVYAALRTGARPQERTA